MCIYIYTYIYITHTHIYIYAHAPPPPMIHPNLLFVSSGSWEVGNLRCENIDKDQVSPKIFEA